MGILQYLDPRPLIDQLKAIWEMLIELSIAHKKEGGLLMDIKTGLKEIQDAQKAEQADTKLFIALTGRLILQVANGELTEAQVKEITDPMLSDDADIKAAIAAVQAVLPPDAPPAPVVDPNAP